MTIHLLSLENYPIADQLKMEEKLLQSDTRNWCIISRGAAIPTVVMGISGKQHELVSAEIPSDIPVIRRFSGGGTVIVDEHTLFVTFIFNKSTHPFPAFPERIMRWTADFYQAAFDIPAFHLKENDYAIGDRKCGGNAQYIKKERWLHHTSFLWDFQEERMGYLLHPKKTPAYREGRRHADFLCKLSTHFSHPSDVMTAIRNELGKRYTISDGLV